MPEAYADAVSTYLALAVSRQTNRGSSLSTWQSVGEKIAQLFTRQTIPMVWDYAEANPFSNSSGNFGSQIGWICKSILHVPAAMDGKLLKLMQSFRSYAGRVISTDPPYYDNIGYADLSDFFLCVAAT